MYMGYGRFGGDDHQERRARHRLRKAKHLMNFVGAAAEHLHTHVPEHMSVQDGEEEGDESPSGRPFFGGAHFHPGHFFFRGGPHGGFFGGGHFGRGGGPRGRRGSRVRRGDVRLSILTLLAEEPRNGYQLIQEIGERSGGRWKPSPGSVYPALQQLEDEGLIRAEESDSKKRFTLTEAGQVYLNEQKNDEAPWESIGDDLPEGLQEMQQLVGQVMEATMTLAYSGSSEQQKRAQKLLKKTRRSLYQILSEDEDDKADDAGDE